MSTETHAAKPSFAINPPLKAIHRVKRTRAITYGILGETTHVIRACPRINQHRFEASMKTHWHALMFGVRTHLRARIANGDAPALLVKQLQPSEAHVVLVPPGGAYVHSQTLAVRQLWNYEHVLFLVLGFVGGAVGGRGALSRDAGLWTRAPAGSTTKHDDNKPTHSSSR